MRSPFSPLKPEDVDNVLHSPVMVAQESGVKRPTIRLQFWPLENRFELVIDGESVESWTVVWGMWSYDDARDQAINSFNKRTGRT